MGGKKYKILGMGNAIVDLFAHVDDDFLDHHKLEKGVTRLVENHEVDKLHEAVKIADTASGGSAANTVAGAAALGLFSAFIGKIGDDHFGDSFEKGLTNCGVHCHAKKVAGQMSTARSLILVTPDAERTMNTYLGIAGHLEPQDVDESVVQNSEIVYFEGYLWDRQSAKDASRKAIDIARKHKAKTAISLSDSFCVDRHRSAFLDLAKNHVDILFSNEAEIKSLFETKSLDSAVGECKKLGAMVALTLADKGSIIISGGKIYNIPAEQVLKVVDTTGAGDLFAAGFLSGIAHNQRLEVCGRMGSIAAAEVISHFGARPKRHLSELMAEKGIEL